jgi:hypothetical protein
MIDFIFCFSVGIPVVTTAKLVYKLSGVFKADKVSNHSPPEWFFYKII